VLRQTNSDSDQGDLVSSVGDEIKVTLDRWSVGQLGLTDLVIAGAIVVTGVLLAWIASRVAKRFARRTDGAARAAWATGGLLVATLIMLLATSIALEVLGFGLGPILVLVLLVVIALLLLRPLVTNLSSGLLLQVRGALEAGDLVRTNGTLGVVEEINARSVVIDTSDGRRVHIPNNDVLNDTIENYSSIGRRRSEIEFAVDATTDRERVLAVTAESLAEASGVLDDPPPEAMLVRVTGPFLVIRAQVWHGPLMSDARHAVSEAIRTILDGLAAADIDVDGPPWMVLETKSPAEPPSSRAGRG